MNLKFPLGQTVATPNALDQLTPEDVLCGLQRHQSGDWGDVCEDDKKENDLALQKGIRLFSAYRTPTHKKFWIIRDATATIACSILATAARLGFCA